MAYSFEDIGRSWKSTLVFIVALGATLFALTYLDGTGRFETHDSVLWWLGSLIAIVALVTTYVRQEKEG